VRDTRGISGDESAHDRTVAVARGFFFLLELLRDFELALCIGLPSHFEAGAAQLIVDEALEGIKALGGF